MTIDEFTETDIPAEWIDAGAAALNDPPWEVDRVKARWVLTAVLPLIREQIAADIETLTGRTRDWDYGAAIDDAARIAREGRA